jgi:hypothetical protein
MSHLVLGLIGMAGIGLAIGAIFHQAGKPRRGHMRFDNSANYGDGGYFGGGADGGHGGHGGDGGH